MVWTRRKGDLGMIDSKIVKNGFIIARGVQAVGPFFLEKGKNPFKRDFYTPVFYLFKVHKNHPLRILSTGVDYATVSPKKYNKVPEEIYRNRMDYDITTFLLSPYDPGEIEKYHWKKFSLENSFVTGSGLEERDGCLLYLEHGWDIHPQDSLLVSEVLPSQILSHFYDWMGRANRIWSHDETFDQKLEGRIEIPFEVARKVSIEVSRILEKRYKTKLLFDQQRKRD